QTAAEALGTPPLRACGMQLKDAWETTARPTMEDLDVSITAHSITSTDEELREALLSANIPTLLMVLAHVTGDHSWLEPPYIPTRTIALNDNDTAGFSDELQEAVREGALEMIRNW